jgi:hypothetical protein
MLFFILPLIEVEPFSFERTLLKSLLVLEALSLQSVIEILKKKAP